MSPLLHWMFAVPPQVSPSFAPCLEAFGSSTHVPVLSPAVVVAAQAGVATRACEPSAHLAAAGGVVLFADADLLFSRVAARREHRNEGQGHPGRKEHGEEEGFAHGYISLQARLVPFERATTLRYLRRTNGRSTLRSGHRVIHPPAVLLFHGLRTSKESLEAESRALEAAGLAPILVDAPHHGARRSAFLDTMPDTSTAEGQRRLLVILREARDEVPALVDGLLAQGHPRVAIMGVSMGGFIALAAATVEPHLSAIVSILGSPEWWGEPDAPIHSPDAFPPRPLLMLNGARDENVSPEGARALALALRPRYEAQRRDDALVHREWDVPHFVPAEVWREMIAEATAFLRQYA